MLTSITGLYVESKSISSLWLKPCTTSLTLNQMTCPWASRFFVKMSLCPMGLVVRVWQCSPKTLCFLSESYSARSAASHLDHSALCWASSKVRGSRSSSTFSYVGKLALEYNVEILRLREFRVRLEPGVGTRVTRDASAKASGSLFAKAWSCKIFWTSVSGSVVRGSGFMVKVWGE